MTTRGSRRDLGPAPVAAEADLDSAREATRRARVARDRARELSIQHASLASYGSVPDLAELALFAALDRERAAEEALQDVLDQIAFAEGSTS